MVFLRQSPNLRVSSIVFALISRKAAVNLYVLVPVDASSSRYYLRATLRILPPNQCSPVYVNRGI